MIETIKRKVRNKGRVHNVVEFFFKGGAYPKHIGTLILRRGKPRIYYKKVNSQKHKMRILDGYGIQKEVFDKFLRGKKGKVIIEETDTWTRWEADIKVWEEHGKYANYGEEKQVFLSVKYMEKLKVLVL